MREMKSYEIQSQPKFVENPLDFKTGRQKRSERRKKLQKGKKKFGY